MPMHCEPFAAVTAAQWLLQLHVCAVQCSVSIIC